MTVAELMAVSHNDEQKVTIKDSTDTIKMVFFDQYYEQLGADLLAYNVTSFTVDRTNGLIISGTPAE